MTEGRARGEDETTPEPRVLAQVPIRAVMWTGIAAVVVVNIANATSVATEPWNGGTLSLTRDWLLLVNENNPPTWVAGTLWLLAALAALACGWAATQSKERLRWIEVAALLAFFSLDEVASIHEKADEWLGIEGSGFLLYAWLIPGIVILVVVMAHLGPFVWRLPSRTRLMLVAGLGLLVLGGMGFESLASAHHDSNGADNITYHLISAVEENLEYAGSLVALAGLLQHLRTASFRFTFSD